MGMTQDVIARLEAQIPALAGRVMGAADLTALMQRNELPQVTPAAHVIPSGLSGGKTHTVTAAFDQKVSRLFVVLLTLRARDKVSTRGLDDVESLLDTVIAALLGWTPAPDTTGVFELRGVRLVSMAADALVYQLDFTLPDHLRILS